LPRALRRREFGAARGLGKAALAAAVVLALAALLATPNPLSAAYDLAIPVAGSFVYPVGDELDFTKSHEGEAYGYYVSDGYLARRGRKKQRTHYGVDFAQGRGGAPIRAIASGVVVVADANALVKVRRKQQIKVPVIEKGKRVYKKSTRWRSVYKWRTGWGNYVVVRHMLPSGETVHSLYAHMQPRSMLVKRGDVVAAGQPLGKVGRSGRASSAHLHLEIRKATRDPDADAVPEDGEEDEPTPDERRFSLLQTVDPINFLEQHVRRYEDLDPSSWQARYALAACRDGLVAGDREKFEPDESVTRGEYFRTLVLAFRLASPFSTKSYESTVNTLVDSEILDPSGAHDAAAGDKISRSEALEVLMRCLDRHQARARNLASIDALQISRDFNREFAGPESSVAAEARAKSLANAETRARQKAEYDRVARARNTAKAAGKRSTAKVKPVEPAKPVPVLDPGFEAIAQSKKNITRAESCLLLATALRTGTERYTALGRAATRIADRVADPG
jgi:murein DD-endopeptidase MepM/ murein hydrolase activator NlpD